MKVNVGTLWRLTPSSLAVYSYSHDTEKNLQTYPHPPELCVGAPRHSETCFAVSWAHQHMAYTYALHPCPEVGNTIINFFFMSKSRD